MYHPTSAPVRFGLFELDARSGELRRRGLAVKLTPQARALLCLLLEAPIRTRTREEIQQRLWSADTFVDFEHGVNKVVHSLREALGETAANPHFIETVTTEGYRFLPQFLEQGPASGYSHAALDWLAVLPIATEPEDDLIFLGRRISASLIDELSCIHGVRVMAESTLKSHNLKGYGPQQAGERLGVRTVLSGELTRFGTALSLHTELIDVADGALLRGAHVDGVSQDSIHCVAELVQGIIEQIQLLVNAPARLRKLPVPVLVPEREANVS